jgi:hypothetical protein
LDVRWDGTEGRCGFVARHVTIGTCCKRVVRIVIMTEGMRGERELCVEDTCTWAAYWLQPR